MSNKSKKLRQMKAKSKEQKVTSNEGKKVRSQKIKKLW